jgi:hypothetical protein
MGSMSIGVSLRTGMLSNKPHSALVSNIDGSLQVGNILVVGSNFHVGDTSQSKGVVMPPGQVHILYLGLLREIFFQEIQQILLDLLFGQLLDLDCNVPCDGEDQHVFCGIFAHPRKRILAELIFACKSYRTCVIWPEWFLECHI